MDIFQHLWDKHELNHKPTQITPPIDEYTAGIQTRPTLVLDDDSPLLKPKEVFQPTKQLKSPADTTSEGKTPVSQVTLLLEAPHPAKTTKSNIGTCQTIFWTY